MLILLKLSQKIEVESTLLRHSMKPPSPWHQSQKQYQKKQLHAIIFGEYICKNSQQNISKPQIQQHKKRSYITSPGSTAQETPLHCSEDLAQPNKTKKITTTKLDSSRGHKDGSMYAN